MEILKPYRARIDALDDRIVDLLIERTGIIREVAHLKFREGMPAVLMDRVIEVRERSATRAGVGGMDDDIVRRMYSLLIEYSCNLEEEMMTAMAKEKAE